MCARRTNDESKSNLNLAKDTTQPDKNEKFPSNKDSTSPGNVQYPLLMHNKSFYQTVHEKLLSLDHGITCAAREKHDKIKITLRSQSNGSNINFLKLIRKPGCKNAHDWVKSFS